MKTGTCQKSNYPLPQPPTEYLKLKLVNSAVINLIYQLYDLNDELIDNMKLDGAENYFKMDMINPSVYYLKVSIKSKEKKTFKIIKY